MRRRQPKCDFCGKRAEQPYDGWCEHCAAVAQGEVAATTPREHLLRMAYTEESPHIRRLCMHVANA